MFIRIWNETNIRINIENSNSLNLIWFPNPTMDDFFGICNRAGLRTDQFGEETGQHGEEQSCKGNWSVTCK